MERVDCAYCGKKQDLPFECNYCNDKFCSEHRLPENHRCVKLLQIKTGKIGEEKIPRTKEMGKDNVKPRREIKGRTIYASIALCGLIGFVVIELLVSNGVILPSFQKEVEKQTGQQIQQITNIAESKLHLKSSTTTIRNETIMWDFTDSRGNPYHWEMPMSSYDALVAKPLPQKYINLQFANGTTVQELDYTQFVGHDFSKSIDQIYDNAGSDDQFVYEVWYIVSQMTTYSVDLTNSNLWSLQVMTRAGGDCKDLSILIADMIRSSSHTKDWEVKLVYMDADNPSDPKTINHMIVEVNTGKKSYKIEATGKDPEGFHYWKDNGFHYWDDKNIIGWQYAV